MIALGTALRLGLGRYRVDLGGIEDVDAAVEGVVHLGVALGLAVLLAEGHGAETQPGNFHAGAAKLAVIHGDANCPCRRGSSSRGRVEFDGPRSLDLLLGLLGGEERGDDQPQHEGRNGQERDGRANFAEM